MEIIFNRRSIRKYQDKPVEQEKIEKMLRAAMQAPSAANQQPWEFIVVKDRTRLIELSQVSPYSKMVEKAPVAVVFLSKNGEMKLQRSIPQDMGAAIENFLLEAVELGLGAVWLGVAPVQERMDVIKKMFDLPEGIEPFAIVPVGYPEGEQNKFIDRFDATRVHDERWTANNKGEKYVKL